MQQHKLRVCVVGAGAIGGVLAAMLARAGSTVSVVARGAHLQAIQQNGLRLTSTAGLRNFTAQVEATDDPAQLGHQDVVMIALKAHDVPGIAAKVQPLVGDTTIVVPILNGIPWWYFHGLRGIPHAQPIACLDPAGDAARHIPMHAIIGCVVRIAATVPAPGVVRHTHGNRFILGEPSCEMSARLRRLATVLQDAGFDAAATTRIRDEIWTKLQGNLATNPLSALTHASLGELCENPALVSLMRRAMQECMAIGEAWGIAFTSDLETSLERFRGLGDSKPSMLQDVEKGRPMEIASIVQAPIELARRAGIATPTLDAILALISERARHLEQELAR